MNNVDRLINVFVRSFEIKKDDALIAAYKKIDSWDSVGQMTLVSNLEEEFNITILPQDIMAIYSFDTAKQILSENYNIIF